MKTKFKNLLHDYKVEAFKIAHNNEQISEHTSEILRFTEEALNNAYTYHFHEGDANKDRLETFTMIKNFTLEALLPPVLEKIMRRVVVLERQNAEMVRLIDGILEALSKQEKSGDAQVG